MISPIVYTGGTFDVLHAGHMDLLALCKVIAGRDGKVVVALNRDSFVKEFKGTAPVCTFAERKTMLQCCRFVDDVIENTGDADSRTVIKRVNASIIVIGDDWATKDYYAQMGFDRDWLSAQGIALIYVARLRPLSSTEIKARVNG